MASISGRDRDILRDLARRVAELAADPAQQAKLTEWKRHNGLRPGKPMVLVYAEDVWGEFLPGDVLQCEGKPARGIEWDLRSRLYHAEHLRDDKVFTGTYDVALEVADPGCGLPWNYNRHDVDGLRRTEAFECRIPDDADPADFVHTRAVTIDRDGTQRRWEKMNELLGDILTVRIQGVRSFGFCPIDVFIQWRGIEQLFRDMVDRPEWLHAFFDRMTESEIDAARQLEAAGAVEMNNGPDGVGSGGLAATDELPADGFDGEHVRLRDLWGFATTQIFSEVSPAMHDEFAITYEARFLGLFGLNCYGCCEPLHKKVHLIRKLPRVRRVSMSPFVDWAEGAEQIGGDFIYSAKPNPSYVTTADWDIEPCRREIVTILDAARRNSCVVEFVLNSTLTSHGEPRRFDEWTDMVQDLARKYA